MLKHIGTTEEPIGSNRGHFVDSVNRLFGLTAAPWCATTASAFVSEADIAPKVWSAIALDFATGDQYSVKQVAEGEYTPKLGDYLVWKYGGGRGHVDFVENYDSETGTWIYAGANRSDRVAHGKSTTNELIMKRAYCVVDVQPKWPDIQAQTGIASVYSDQLAGRPTKSGKPYDPTKMTAAHRTLPIGTVVFVTNPDNGKSVVVVVNDRGPFVEGRIIDLSRAAAEKIDLRLGLVRIIWKDHGKPT